MRPGLGPPLSIERTMAPGVIVLLLVVAAMVHDWRSRGRVHPAYWWSFGALLVVFAARPVIGHSGAWLRFTDFLLAF